MLDYVVQGERAMKLEESAAELITLTFGLLFASRACSERSVNSASLRSNPPLDDD